GVVGGEMGRKAVLVAGATGDIGSRVVRLLAAEGHSVRAAVRARSLSSPRAKALLAPGGVESVVLDPFAPASWTAALEGVDVVVSTLGASVALAPRGWQSFERVDLAAHRALAAALPASGVGRVVYLSAET